MNELQAVAVVVELTLYAFGAAIGYRLMDDWLAKKTAKKWAEWDAKKKAGKNEA